MSNDQKWIFQFQDKPNQLIRLILLTSVLVEFQWKTENIRILKILGSIVEYLWNQVHFILTILREISKNEILCFELGIIHELPKAKGGGIALGSNLVWNYVFTQSCFPNNHCYFSMKYWRNWWHKCNGWKVWSNGTPLNNYLDSHHSQGVWICLTNFTST